MSKALSWDWLMGAVRGFQVCGGVPVGGVMATDFRVSVHQQADAERWAVNITDEHGDSATAMCRTRDHFRALAGIVGMPLRDPAIADPDGTVDLDDMARAT